MGGCRCARAASRQGRALRRCSRCGAGGAHPTQHFDASLRHRWSRWRIARCCCATVHTSGRRSRCHVHCALRAAELDYAPLHACEQLAWRRSWQGAACRGGGARLGDGHGREDTGAIGRTPLQLVLACFDPRRSQMLLLAPFAASSSTRYDHRGDGGCLREGWIAVVCRKGGGWTLAFISSVRGSPLRS